MKLLRGIKHFTELDKGVVATIGNFDGVHLGHQQLLLSLKEKAQQMNLPSLLILFEPQPKEYLQPHQAHARLSSLRDKLALLKSCPLDYVYCIKFDDGFAKTSASEFIHRYLFSTLQVKYLLVGQDFQFGKNREGDVALLKNLGIKEGCEVHSYPDYCINEERVSSTKIRTALKQGLMELVTIYLGRPYSLCGRVVRGKGLGRQWGIPTANFNFRNRILPLQGVFIVQVLRQGTLISGVANLGKRPTVDGTKTSLEVHLFNFNDSLYGECLQVFFLHKLRDEVKFTSVDALITQIHQDIESAQAFLQLNVL